MKPVARIAVGFTITECELMSGESTPSGVQLVNVLQLAGVNIRAAARGFFSRKE